MTTNPSGDPTGKAAGCPEGEPIDVAAARVAGHGPVAVTGYVFVDGETVVLSTNIRESYPPQPGEDTMLVRGLDLGEFDAVERVGNIAWTPRPVVVRGVVQESVLRVDPDC